MSSYVETRRRREAKYARGARGRALTFLRQYYGARYKLGDRPRWVFTATPDANRYASGEEWLTDVLQRRLTASYGHFKTGPPQHRQVVARMVKELRHKARHADPVVSAAA